MATSAEKNREAQARHRARRKAAWEELQRMVKAAETEEPPVASPSDVKAAVLPVSREPDWAGLEALVGRLWDAHASYSTWRSQILAWMAEQRRCSP